KRYERGPLPGSLSESPMPIRSGAMQRPSGCRCGNTLRQRYDEVGLPCNSTMGSPCPTSTYAISQPRTRRRCFWYGNAEEIMFASPPVTKGKRHAKTVGFNPIAVHRYNLFRRQKMSRRSRMDLKSQRQVCDGYPTLSLRDVRQRHT